MSREWLPTAALLVVAAGLVGSVQGAAAAAHHRAKETSDVYGLPPPDDVVKLSMGYRAAVADLLWAHVLVSQGLHTQEKRRFDNLIPLLDAINALDPEFREPYLLADALITFQTSETPHEEVVKTREILERGVRNRPDDAELWLALGEFTAFIAPAGYLKDPVEKEEWRAAGAKTLARAAELGGGRASISWQALGGAGILRRAGERDASIRFLRRTMAITDDDELKADIQKRLEALLGEEQADQIKRRSAAFTALWRRDLPFISKTSALVLGPPPDPAYCAGGRHAEEARCATTWRDWFERLDTATSR